MLHASELCVQGEGISFVFFCCPFFILLFNTNAALLSPVQWKIETQYSMRGALNGTLVAVLCPFRAKHDGTLPLKS